jgi:acyl carrier protein
MGLDTVEFILEIEDEYSIRISDAEAENIGRVGELAKFIVTKVIKEQGKRLEYENVLKRIIDKLVQNHAIEREIITPDSHFVRDLLLD